MHLRRNRRAIDEQLSPGVDEKIVRGAKNFMHCRIVGDDSKNNFCARAYVGQRLTCGATEFLREGRRCRAVRVVNGSDVKAAILEAARHVRAHPAHSDETDVHTRMLEARTVLPNSKLAFQRV